MTQDKPSRTEGDINLSPARAKWQQEQLSSATIEILADDAKYFLHQTLSTPCLNVVRSCQGIWLEDWQGKRYMDFHGNNVHQVGFANPKVIAAVKQQLDELSFSTRRYTNTKAVQLAKTLAELAPGSLNKVLFSPGATSAIGMALKLARIASGRFKTISMWDSFHGASLDAISIGGEATFRKGIGPLLSGTEHVLPINNYRCIWGDCRSCRLECVKYLNYVCEREQDIGAVIIETVRNTDVQIPPPGYFKAVREICDKHGILLILDETAIALGRTGKMFAVENFDIVPDMVVIGKGLGGGIFPMAGLIVKEELDLARHCSIGHYTHEKSPVGAAAALAVIDFIKEHNLLQRTAELGERLRQGLEWLMKKHAGIGQVRGVGLLYGIELVVDGMTKEPAVDYAEKVMYHSLERGLSFKVSQGNVITLSPPLIISEQELERAIAILDEALSASLM